MLGEPAVGDPKQVSNIGCWVGLYSVFCKQDCKTSKTSRFHELVVIMIEIKKLSI